MHLLARLAGIAFQFSLAAKSAASLDALDGEDCRTAETELDAVSLLQVDLGISKSKLASVVEISTADTGSKGKKGLAPQTDIELNLPNVQAGSCGKSVTNTGMTNPSFVIVPGTDTVLSAMRGNCFGIMRVEESKLVGSWESNLILGTTPATEIHSGKPSLAWSTYASVDDPRLEHSDGLAECLDPARASVTVSKGPEDPRLFTNDGKIYMMFIGAPMLPQNLTLPAERLKLFPAYAATGRPPCQEQKFLPHVTELVSPPPNLRFGPVVPVLFEGMHKIEKNWSPFSWRRSEGGKEQSFMVYDMHPHTILRIDLATGAAQKAYAEKSSLLVSLADEVGVNVTDFHCGSSVAPVKCADGSPCNLGVFHLHRDEPGQLLNRSYSHWPYKFSAQPPFEIREVGSQLPLKSKIHPQCATGACDWKVQFVTSLLVDADHVIIGYNTGDVTTNIFRMALDEFESRFFLEHSKAGAHEKAGPGWLALAMGLFLPSFLP